VFCCCLVFALVLGRWKESFKAAWAAKEEAAVDGPADLVSLVVPARNAADTLTALLQDLHAQAWPKDKLEVIVVDDHSVDGTAGIVQGMAPAWPQLRVIGARGEGKKAAITTGMEAAAGAWVVLTDADARCGPLRVRRIMEQVGRHPCDLVLMPVETRASGGLVQWLQAEEQMALLGVAAGSALGGTPTLANGANMAVRKSAFLGVGGYAGDRWASGDDLFLLKRMLRAGRKVDYLLAPEVLVHVDAETTWAGFLKQRLRWAGKMRAVGGAGTWAALGAILLLWLLLGVCLSYGMTGWGAYDPVTCLLLLAACWLLWLLPVLALVRAVRRYLRAADAPDHGRGSVVHTLLALMAFQVYAPVLAVLSLFIRPHWKGRPA
jgi:hypothetical protein